jgi:hypothetical protein
MDDFQVAFDTFKQSGKNLGLEYLTIDIIYNRSVKYLSGIVQKEKKIMDQRLSEFQKKQGKMYPPGSCGNLHNLHLEDIGLIISKAKFLYLTAGALYKGDKNLYDVPPKGQMASLFGGGTQKFHAWITLDSGEIIDLAHNLTLSYLFNDKKLINPIYGSPETINKKLGLQYVPYQIYGHIDNAITF